MKDNTNGAYSSTLNAIYLEDTTVIMIEVKIAL